MDKLTRKELKSDKFALEVQHSVEYVSQHRQLMVRWAAPAVAVVLLVVNRLRLQAAYLRWWGINPLLLYIMHYLLLALVVLPDVPSWHVQAPIPLVIAQAAVIIAILSVAAWFLSRRERPFSL